MILAMLCDSLSVTDLMTIIGGDMTPLDRARNHIRRFVIEKVLNDNDRPSADDLKSASARMTSSNDDIRTIVVGDTSTDTDVTTNSPINLIASLINVERAAIERVLRLIFEIDSSIRNEQGIEVQFGRAILNIITLYGRQIAALCNIAFDGREDGYEAVIRRYLLSQTADTSDELRNWLGETGVAKFRELLQREGPLTPADVREYIVETEQSTIVDELSSTDVHMQTIDNIDEPNSSVTLLPTKSETTGLDMTQSTTEQQISPPAPQTSVPPTEVLSSGDQSWKRVLPADWVAVIEGDIERQRTMAEQAPFSDAYLAGMPAKRRKMILHARRQTALQNVDRRLRDTLLSAIQETGAQPLNATTSIDQLLANVEFDNELLTVYGQRFDDEIRRRLQTDVDYDANKFPAADKYFEP